MNRKVKDADANEGFEDSSDPQQSKLLQNQKRLRQQKSGSIKVHQLHIVELVIVFVSTPGDAVKFSYTATMKV